MKLLSKIVNYVCALYLPRYPGFTISFDNFNTKKTVFLYSGFRTDSRCQYQIL